MVRPSKSEYHNYYGEFAVAPTVPAPTAGDMYFDTLTTTMMYWDGAAWQPFGGGASVYGYGEIYYDGGICPPSYQNVATGHCSIGYTVIHPVTVGLTQGIAGNINGTLTVNAGFGGRYRFQVSLTVGTANANRVPIGAVFVNGVRIGKISTGQFISATGTGRIWSITASGLLDLFDGDVVDFRITGRDNNLTLQVRYYNMSINQIGGLGSSSAISHVGVVVKRTAVLSVPSGGGGTIIPWTAEDYDTNGFHDNIVNNSRLTVPAGYDGKYAIWCNLIFNTPTTVNRVYQCAFFVNGVGVGAWNNLCQTSTVMNPTPSLFIVKELVAGDFIECRAYHNDTVAKNMQAESRFGMYKI